MRGPFMTGNLALRVLWLALVPGAFWTAAWAAPPAEETIFQSTELRIYRTVNRDGIPIMVLTNVDEAGDYFPGRIVEPAGQGVRSMPPIPAASPGTPDCPAAP